MLDEEILKFVISANIPFNQVENEHFRRIISWIQVNKHSAQAPSRKVIRARLSSKSELAKENLRKILAANSSKISLAMDCWSTRTNYGFLSTYSISHKNLVSSYRNDDFYAIFSEQTLICQAITAHWIDEMWNLHETLLDFRHVQGRHTGDHLGQELFDVLEYYNISEKLFCITSDSAGNCGKTCEALTKILRDEKGIRWNHKERYIRCMNHVINLAVQDFLKSIRAFTSEEEDNNVEESEDAKDDNDTLPEGFALAMWKIRELTKVFYMTYQILMTNC